MVSWKAKLLSPPPPSPVVSYLKALLISSFWPLFKCCFLRELIPNHTIWNSPFFPLSYLFTLYVPNASQHLPLECAFIYSLFISTSRMYVLSSCLLLYTSYPKPRIGPGVEMMFNKYLNWTNKWMSGVCPLYLTFPSPSWLTLLQLVTCG